MASRPDDGLHSSPKIWAEQRDHSAYYLPMASKGTVIYDVECVRGARALAVELKKCFIFSCFQASLARRPPELPTQTHFYMCVPIRVVSTKFYRCDVMNFSLFYSPRGRHKTFANSAAAYTLKHTHAILLRSIAFPVRVGGGVSFKVVADTELCESFAFYFNRGGAEGDEEGQVT